MGYLDLNEVVLSEPQSTGLDLNNVEAFFDYQEFYDRVRAEAPNWVPALYPSGRLSQDRREWRVANPSGRAPRDKGSFVIQLHGPKAGTGYEYDGSTPYTAVEMVQAARPGEDATAWLAARVGMDASAGYTPTLRPRIASQATPIPAPAPRDPDRYKGDVALLLSKCVPAKGSPVEDYFKSRGIPLPESGDLKYCADITDHAAKRGYQGMVAIVRAPDGTQMKGVHRTMLHDDIGGNDKAKHKKMLAECAGGAVRLAPMSDDGRLAICEGIESGAAAMWLHGEPTWATLSTSGMVRFDAAQVPGLKFLTIYTDAGDAGLEAAHTAANAAMLAGIPGEIVTSVSDDDFALDVKQGERPGLTRADAQVIHQWGGTSAQAVTTSRRVKPSPEELDALIEDARKLTRESHLSDKRAIAERVAAFDLSHDPVAMGELERLMKTGAGVDKLKFRQQVATLAAPLVGDIIPPGTRTLMRNAAVDAMCARYIHIKEVGQYWDRASRKWFSKTAVQDSHWSEMPPGSDGTPIDPLDYLIRDKASRVTKVDAVTFWPNRDEVVMDGGALCLNTWTPPDIQPRRGDAAPFVDHVRFLFDGQDDLASHFLDWLAHAVQHPDKKIRHVPLIVSPLEGVGKNRMLDAVAPAIGRRNMRFVSGEELNSNYNDFLVGAGLIVIPEMLIGDRRDLMTRMNTWITDEEVSIHPKGFKGFSYPNRFNMMAFSNHEDAALLRSGDRRYFVHICRSEPKPAAYYTGFTNWLETGGYEVVANFLHSRDLSHFNPNANAPMTASKALMIEGGKSAIVSFLSELHRAGMAPFDKEIIASVHVVAYLRDYHKQTVSPKQLSNFLRETGAENLGPQYVNATERPTVWALRNIDRWKNASADDFKREYCAPGWANDGVLG
ncbi:MAG TPA: DUF5906 domain-containing protein [Magnetospirillum sp.]|nr:DUF5906 domain-containing protein [Magnetospirillum sp.]